jgi:hypothetical protein
MPRPKIKFIAYQPEGFKKSLAEGAYTKFFFKPVDEFVYVIKDKLDKDLFPFKDHAVYYQEEILFCKEMLEAVKAGKIPEDMAIKNVRSIHYLVKMFEGTIQRGRHIDPDPTIGKTPDVRYWKRLNDYAFTVIKDAEFDEAIKALRMKHFKIWPNSTGALGLFPPNKMGKEEKQAVSYKYIIPNKEHIKEALSCISDVTPRN